MPFTLEAGVHVAFYPEQKEGETEKTKNRAHNDSAGLQGKLPEAASRKKNIPHMMKPNDGQHSDLLRVESSDCVAEITVKVVGGTDEAGDCQEYRHNEGG